MISLFIWQEFLGFVEFIFLLSLCQLSHTCACLFLYCSFLWNPLSYQHEQPALWGKKLLSCLMLCIALSKNVGVCRFLFGCQSRLLRCSLLKHCPEYFSTLRSRIQHCFLEADATVAAPSFAGCVCVECMGLLYLLHLNLSLCQLSIGPFPASASLGTNTFYSI